MKESGVGGGLGSHNGTSEMVYGRQGAVRICLSRFVAAKVPRQLCRSLCNPSAETRGTQCAAIPSSPTCSMMGQGLAWQGPQRSYLQK